MKGVAIPGLMGLWINASNIDKLSYNYYVSLKEGSLHCMSTLNDSLSLLKSVNDNFKKCLHHDLHVVQCKPPRRDQPSLQRPMALSPLHVHGLSLEVSL